MSRHGRKILLNLIDWLVLSFKVLLFLTHPIRYDPGEAGKSCSFCDLDIIVRDDKLSCCRFPHNNGTVCGRWLDSPGQGNGRRENIDIMSFRAQTQCSDLCFALDD